MSHTSSRGSWLSGAWRLFTCISWTFATAQFAALHSSISTVVLANMKIIRRDLTVLVSQSCLASIERLIPKEVAMWLSCHFQ
jgi:hypothetical protein